MFTGIVSGVGTVRRLNRRGQDAVLEVETAMDLTDVRIGDSIAVDGVCLTVTSLGGGAFAADVSAETLSRTTLGLAAPGRRVNLEKALRLGDRLGGHIVLGHVDCVGVIGDKAVAGKSVRMGLRIDPSCGRYVANKGSVAVDGVSLTVNGWEKGLFYVNIIPHTAAATTLAEKKVSDQVNVETDVLARYVERLIGSAEGEQARGIDLEMLGRYGFLK